MSQQMNFDEINRDEHASYTAGHEETPRYQDYSPGSFGQKLTGHEAGRNATPGQRLALAIVSLVLLMLMALILVGAALANLSPSVVENFAPLFVFMFLGFLAAVIVINVVFNRKR
jgi:hypothetical protein